MKKKRTYTRRQRAVRWLVALLAVLMLGHFSGSYNLFPTQTIDTIRQMEVLDELEVLHSEWGHHAPMTAKRIYLSQNEQSFLLSAAAFHPMFGWYHEGPGIVINRDDPDSYPAVWSASKDEKVWVCLAGFVPDGETPPTFSLGLAERGDTLVDDVGDLQYVDQPLTVTPVADIPVSGGTCYLETYSLSSREESQTILVALNENGYLSFPENWCSTSFL